MNRRALLLAPALLGWAAAAPAQQRAAVPRVGVLHPGNNATLELNVAAIRDGMRDIAGGEERSVGILGRAADFNADRLAGFAAELAGSGVDLIVAISPAAVRAVVDATTTIPIIAHDLESDPVANGWVARLARPGGNLTGVFLDFPEVSAKCLQLLAEAVPTVSRVAVLWDPGTGPLQLKAVETAAGSLRLGTRVFEVGGIAAVETAFRSAVAEGCDAAMLLSSPLFGSNPRVVAALSIQHRLPAVTLFPAFAQEGGLLAYGPNLQHLHRQAGRMAGKVLQGAKVQELPVERPTHIELVVNLKTARRFGLTLPAAILQRAVEVVE